MNYEFVMFLQYLPLLSQIKDEFITQELFTELLYLQFLINKVRTIITETFKVWKFKRLKMFFSSSLCLFCIDQTIFVTILKFNYPNCFSHFSILTFDSPKCNITINRREHFRHLCRKTAVLQSSWSKGISETRSKHQNPCSKCIIIHVTSRAKK